MRTVTAVVACTAVLVVGCAPQGQPPDDRAPAIRAARAALGEAIARLGSAVVGTEEAISRVRLGDPPDAGERLEAVAAVREGSVSDLESALAATADADPQGSDPAVEAARASWREARAAAEDLLSAAGPDLDQTELLARTDATLAGIVDGWATPGSRSEQVQRFTELRDRARSLVGELDGAQPDPRCSEGLRRRLDAATWVAEATEELRVLVEERRGAEFDERRRALAADVYGLDQVEGDPRTLLGRLDARDQDCWRGHGASPEAAERFEAAIDEVERALNPTDVTD